MHRFLHFVLLTLAIFSLPERSGASETAAFPQGLGEDAFAPLMKNSPFLRMVSVEDTYKLRGVATIGKHTFITLQHRKTEKNITVSDREINELGMSLVEVSGTRPRDTGVTISYEGSEFEFSYEEGALDPAASVPGRRDKVQRDKEGRPVTTAELMSKWRGLKDEQRKQYFKWKNDLLKARPELRFSEKRFPIAHKALDALKAGKALPSVRK